MVKGENVFVTGGTGFVGRNLVEYLLEEGAEVTCLVRKNSRHDFLRRPGIRLVVGELSDEKVLKDCLSGVSRVFHVAGSVAAFSYEEMLAVNCHLTETIAAVCAQQENPPVFLYVSSLAAAGPAESTTRLWVESDFPRPISDYGRSKLAAEYALRQYAARLPITIVRPPMVFGRYGKEMQKWLQTIRNLGIFFIPACRPYRFSMIDAEDLAKLMVLASEKGERLPADEAGVIRNPGEGIYYASHWVYPSYLEMGQLFGSAVGRRHVLTFPISPPVSYLGAYLCYWWSRWCGRPMLPNPDKVREGLAGSWLCSAEKARRQLGFELNEPLETQIQKLASGG